VQNNPRRYARELCLQALYQCEALADWSAQRGQDYLAAFLPEYLDLEQKPEIDLDFAFALFSGVLRERELLEDLIGKASTNWPLEKMTPIDRNILRLSAFELLYHPETSIGICISEALELAKSFSTEEASKFINGVLDKIAAQRKLTDSR